MKEENEITEEVRELLESLEQHGQNVRRQKELSDLIDGLEASGTKHRKLYPLWWIVGTAAAVLLLWLLARPALKETPNLNEEILVEEIGVKDTMQEENETIEESVILEEPIIQEQLWAERTPIPSKKPLTSHLSPLTSQEPQLAENNPSETFSVEPTNSTDTSNIGSNTTPILIEENLSPLTFHLSPPSSPQRRVIRSLNLVCYECKTENGELRTENFPFSTFRSPFEPDPNMKNGSLAFEVKLH